MFKKRSFLIVSILFFLLTSLIVFYYFKYSNLKFKDYLLKKNITPVFVSILNEGMDKDKKNLTSDWLVSLKKIQPFGVIIFQNNIIDKEQLKTFIQNLKKEIRDDIKIAIDREGGRIDRLAWQDLDNFQFFPSAKDFGDKYNQVKKIYSSDKYKVFQEVMTEGSIENFLISVEKIYDKMFQELKDVGINMVFAPNCDITYSTSEPVVIGTRSYGDTETVIKISEVFAKSAIKNNIEIVAKHAPGHGRATNDTHYNSAFVKATKQEILETDMAPYLNLNNKGLLKYIMLPHVIYEDIDNQNIADKSEKVLNFLKDNLSSNIVTISDDESMLSSDNSDLESFCDIRIIGVGKKLQEIEEFIKKNY